MYLKESLWYSSSQSGPGMQRLRHDPLSLPGFLREWVVISLTLPTVTAEMTKSLEYWCDDARVWGN